jgi:crossover junction endodeoxyribonuclease RuvC
MRILGLYPGLEKTGWGVLESTRGKLSYIASGAITTSPKEPMPQRLAVLAADLTEVLRTFAPSHAAVEEVFVNVNPRSSLKLGQARGVCLLVPQQAGCAVFEYAARRVKQSLVGKGNAEKTQVAHMVRTLLPGAAPTTADEADALAVAITHAHHTQSSA